jgi:hypothetical protein
MLAGQWASFREWLSAPTEETMTVPQQNPGAGRPAQNRGQGGRGGNALPITATCILLIAGAVALVLADRVGFIFLILFTTFTAGTAFLMAGFGHPRRKWCPAQRCGGLEVRYNTDFYDIVGHCRALHGGDWITPESIDVYHEVHRQGFAGSVATYRDGQLGGGFWGVGMGRVLSIMTMFHLAGIR